MGDSLRKNKAASFSEWRRRFLDEADEDGHGLIALNRVTRSEAERFVVLELLFHHVNGNYGLGASPRDWKAFRSELNGVRRKALAFASEIRQLRELRIFAVPLIPAAFLAREGGAFPWRQTIDSPHEVFWSSAAKGLTELADYIKYVITEGDKTWDFRDFGNLNLILLSIYLKRITGEWQDERIAMLVRTAYKAAGKHWKSEKNPGAAIAELRRRFRTPESRFDGLLLAVHQTPAGRLTLKKLQLERKRENLPPEPPFTKRYRDQASMQRNLDRAFRKRHRFRDFSTIVLDFMANMETGDPKEFNGSLLGFINLYMVLQLKSWPS